MTVLALIQVLVIYRNSQAISNLCLKLLFENSVASADFKLSLMEYSVWCIFIYLMESARLKESQEPKFKG